jgi:signal transduction histidine kinase
MASMSSIPSLQRSILTRDAFLATVARKLERRLETLGASKVGKNEAIAELLGFARELRIIAEPNRPIPAKKTLGDLFDIVARIFDANGVAERGLQAEARREGAIPGLWDEELLGTILGELVSNAVKYGGAHPITIEARVVRSRALLVVSNHGTWEGPRESPTRFARQETNPKIEGYGIGLWLTARLAKAHGGRVSYTCVAGETKATVSLPCAKEARPEANLRIRLVRQKELRAKGKKRAFSE